MVKKYTINGGKKRGRPKKKKDKRTHSKPKKKQTKNKSRTKCKPCEKKMSQKIDDIIDDIESIKRKNDHDDIDDLLLNSIDDLHKVYRLFKKIEDPKKELLEDEPLDLSDDEDDTDDDADYHVDAFKEQFESPPVEEPPAEPEEPPAELLEKPEPSEELEDNSSITLDDAEQKIIEQPVEGNLQDDNLSDVSDLSDDNLSDVSDISGDDLQVDEKEEIQESPNIIQGGKMKLQNILNELNN